MGANEIALGLTLGIAAFTDWQRQRIYNKLLLPAFGTALLIHLLQGGVSGLEFSLLGSLLGFALLLLPYMLGGIGAGDVKLLAVIGAFGGARFVLTSFLYGAVIGGVIAVILMLRRQALAETIKHFILFSPLGLKSSISDGTIKDAHQEKFPYGIAIAIGTVLALFLPMRGGL